MSTKKAVLAAALKGARTAAGFHTSTDFAKKLDVDPSTVSRWENSKDNKWPTMGHIDKAIGLLGLAGQESVMLAYFAGNPNLVSVLNRTSQEVPEIDDTPPELRLILERLGRLAVENKETLQFLTMAGRMMFRPKPPAADAEAGKRVRRVFLALAEMMKYSPGISANEHEALERVSRRNEA